MNCSINRLNVITFGVDRCSGKCNFCINSTTSFDSYGTGATTIEGLKAEINKIDELTYREAQWDYDTLEKRLLEIQPTHITLWGGDPLTSFKCLQETYDFIKSILPNVKFGLCTNGLALCLDDRVEWIIKNRIRFTLSHDGLGNSNRYGIFNPLEFKNWKKVEKYCGMIECTHSNFNPSPLANYNYFRKYTKVKMGINHVKKFCNEDKDDYVIQGKSLDIFISDMREILRHKWRYNFYDKFIDSNRFDGKRNGCYKYQHGLSKRPVSIDTLGKDTQCFTYDSRLESKEQLRPEYCNNCKFKDRYECNQCNNSGYTHDECKFLKRYMEEVIDWYHGMKWLNSWSVMEAIDAKSKCNTEN